MRLFDFCSPASSSMALRLSTERQASHVMASRSAISNTVMSSMSKGIRLGSTRGTSKFSASLP